MLSSPVSRRTRCTRPHKPFTIAESTGKEIATQYLLLAQDYQRRNDQPNAVSCCLEGLALIFGISRPLVVGDQLQDLLDVLDPCGEITAKIHRAYQQAYC